jgi:hypothetical protein
VHFGFIFSILSGLDFIADNYTLSSSLCGMSSSQP